MDKASLKGVQLIKKERATEATLVIEEALNSVVAPEVVIDNRDHKKVDKILLNTRSLTMILSRTQVA